MSVNEFKPPDFIIENADLYFMANVENFGGGFFIPKVKTF